MRRLGAALVGVLAMGQAQAETPISRRMDLREAITLAVRQNPTLAAEAADVATSQAEVLAARGLDDFAVTGSASWTHSSRPVFGLPFESDDVVVSGGLVRSFPQGGRAELEFRGGFTRASNFLDPMGSKQNQWQPTTTLSFFQPLLRGFGEDTARAAQRRAKAARTVQELERDAAGATLVRDVIIAYWDLASAEKDLAIRHSSLALAKEQLRITQAGIEVGKLAATDALPIEQAIAEREEAILLAELALAERSLELRQLLGMEIGASAIDLVATDRLEVPATDPPLQAAVAAAMEQNPQLRVLSAQGAQAVIEVDVTASGLLPQLDVSASAGPAGNRDEIGAALKEMIEFDKYALSAGATFSMPIENRAAKGTHAAAQGRLHRVRLTEADLRSRIAVAVVRAVHVVRSARKRMEVLAKATQLARRNVELEQARWEVGKSTQFEQLRRQDELAQNEVRETQARADYLKARATLEALTGEIFARHGVRVAE